MSVASKIAQRGIGVLLAINGEGLTYGGLSLNGLVNRAIVRGRDVFSQFKESSINFDLSNLSAIEVLVSDMPTMPEVGEAFVDELGYRHRVRLVIRTDVTWVAYCTPSLIKVQAARGPLAGVGGELIQGVGGEGIQA